MEKNIQELISSRTPSLPSDEDMTTGSQRVCFICKKNIPSKKAFDWHNKYFCSKSCMDEFEKTLPKPKENKTEPYFNYSGSGGMAGY